MSTSEVHEVKDTFSWRKSAAILVASLAINIPVGVAVGSNLLDGVCEQRETVAPGGHASPSELCDQNEKLRSEVAAVIGYFSDIAVPKIDPLFEPKGLED